VVYLALMHLPIKWRKINASSNNNLEEVKAACGAGGKGGEP
jgi:hypothetical protein